MASWSSGWVVAAGNNTETNFNHDLNSTDIVWQIYVADDQEGTNASTLDVQFDYLDSQLDTFGALLHTVTNTSFTLSLGMAYFNKMSSHSELSFAGKYIKVVAVAALADPSPEAAGTEVKFIEPYDITPVVGAWTKIEAQSEWINSNARTLVVKAETFDVDTGGNTSQYLKARTSVASTIEVDIITHGGTSGQRSVASEQALIPCSEDGSFEYYWHRDSSNGTLRNFKVVGYVQRSPFISGSGDLCKFFPDDSGYQMFRNGLTMQWMSSPAFTTESSQLVNFPIPFASKPFKVVASARYPKNDPASTTFFQVASWNEAGVTIFAQSGAASFDPVYADIIAIGITDAIDCVDNSAAASGTKISELKSASVLKDDDLFVLSREKDGDGNYDTTNNVKLSDIAQYVAPPAAEKSIIKITQTLRNVAFGHTDHTGWIGGIYATTVAINMSTGEEATSQFNPILGDGCYYSLAEGTNIKMKKSEISSCYFELILAKAITDLSAILTQSEVESIFRDKGDFNELLITI